MWQFEQYNCGSVETTLNSEADLGSDFHSII